MAELPTGTITFVFTDIEGSTRLLDELGTAYDDALALHRSILREAFAGHGGVEVGTEGDSFFVAFAQASAAISACIAGQLGLLAAQWPGGKALRVRMGIHSGVARLHAEGYVGMAVHRAARVNQAAHGGQVLLSSATRELALEVGGDAFELMDLGEHRLKDLTRPERIFQVCHADLDRSFPPPRTLSARPNNLPVQATTFVGRDREVEELYKLLTESPVRCVTVTGPGGMGKTRLALQAAGNAADEFDGGVWFVPLAAVSDHASVPAAVAAALGVGERAGHQLGDALVEFIAARRLLLLLDNLEQVIEASGFVADLLASCSGLKVLATSREQLRIRGEQNYPLHSLHLPERASPPEELASYPATALFLDRARLARPDFDVSRENAGPIAEICARLDGLPLAIELAAARVRLLPPKALLARLGDQLDILVGGARDLPSRQQTLRSTIAWSHDLLDEPERTTFRRLAVFASGWTIETAEGVCGSDVLETLASLVDKSLVRQDESPDGEPRFFMLESIRAFAAERLAESGELDAIRDLHCELFAEWGEGGLSRRRPMRELGREHDNLCAALDWSIEAGRDGDALRLAFTLGSYWEARGFLTEGRTRLERVLSSTSGEPELRARCVGLAAALAWHQGDLDEARRHYADVLESSLVSADELGRAQALRGLGTVALVQGDYVAARTLLGDALDAARRAGDQPEVADTLNNLGNVSLAMGDLETAESLYGESLAIFRSLKSEHHVSSLATNLGIVAAIRGDYATARRRSLEALEVHRRREDDPAGLAATLISLGEIERYQGRLLDAKAYLDEALAVARDLQDLSSTASALLCLGDVDRLRGDADAAGAHLTEGLSIAEGMGDENSAARARVALALRALALDDVDDARALVERGLSALRELGDTTGTADAMAVLARATESLDPAGAAAAASEATEVAASVGAAATLVTAAIASARALRASRRHEDARGAIAAPLDAAHRSGDLVALAEALDEFAQILTDTGEATLSAQTAGAADELRASIGAPRSAPADRERSALGTRLTAALGENTYEATVARGRSTALADIVQAATPT